MYIKGQLCGYDELVGKRDAPSGPLRQFPPGTPSLGPWRFRQHPADRERAFKAIPAASSVDDRGES